MPVDADKSQEQWQRYVYCRDHGHRAFIDKADKCENFFAGLQWKEEDLAVLKQQRRPALTINKIISTLSTVLGEQIFNRAETSFQPKAGSPSGTADTLTKLWRQIGTSNQLQWVRSDVFCDGVIRSRGFFDQRLNFDDSMQGEMHITQLNAKNVIIDPDAEEYDPDMWNDVFITKWLTPQDVEILYNRDDAEYLAQSQGSVFMYGYDSIERQRDRFGGSTLNMTTGYYSGQDLQKVRRRIRTLERQYRELTTQDHFVDLKTGDMRAIPASWERDRVAHVVQTLGLGVVSKKVKRLRWRVTADNVVLHDDWMPYRHFTVVPYFPFFRYGRTLGIVEHLIEPQELLNKVSSQELHVVNTTANSGWKIKNGALRNMSTEELESRGAQTGIVLELDEIDSAEKIQPNQIPTGLERISYKAEEHIKTISNVSDYMQGNPREDVAAKAVQSNVVRGSVNFSKVMDNLLRTDWILARNGLDMIQEYYSEERIVNIAGDGLLRESETITINEVSETGEIVNDLTIGEFDLVVTSVPFRATLEDEQFEQAVQLKELGVAIPDEDLIQNSRLLNKTELAKKLVAAREAPEAQQDAELVKRGKAAEVAKVESEAKLNDARAQKEGQEAGLVGQGENPEIVKAQLEAQVAREKMQMEAKLEREKMQLEMQLKREQMQGELEIKRAMAVEEAKLKRAQAAQQAAMAKAAPSEGSQQSSAVH